MDSSWMVNSTEYCSSTTFSGLCARATLLLATNLQGVLFEQLSTWPQTQVGWRHPKRVETTAHDWRGTCTASYAHCTVINRIVLTKASKMVMCWLTRTRDLTRINSLVCCWRSTEKIQKLWRTVTGSLVDKCRVIMEKKRLNSVKNFPSMNNHSGGQKWRVSWRKAYLTIILPFQLCLWCRIL